MTVRPAVHGDVQTILDLLARAGLPTSDIGAQRKQTFLVAEEGDVLIGCVAVEHYGRDALLRSLAVVPTAQGSGAGSLLVQTLESAIAKMTRDLWLLTIDQSGFFQRRGFTIVSRGEVPANIASSEEFSALCPATAVLMRKHLS